MFDAAKEGKENGKNKEAMVGAKNEDSKIQAEVVDAEDLRLGEGKDNDTAEFGECDSRQDGRTG